MCISKDSKRETVAVISFRVTVLYPNYLFLNIFNASNVIAIAVCLFHHPLVKL